MVLIPVSELMESFLYFMEVMATEERYMIHFKILSPPLPSPVVPRIEEHIQSSVQMESFLQCVVKIPPQPVSMIQLQIQPYQVLLPLILLVLVLTPSSVPTENF